MSTAKPLLRQGAELAQPVALAKVNSTLAIALGLTLLPWADGVRWLLPDLPLMVRCALACAPAQAHAEVQAAAHHVTAMPGGQGAAREFCDVLLMAAGRYGELLAGHAFEIDIRDSFIQRRIGVAIVAAGLL